jgi:hypothetical protein
MSEPLPARPQDRRQLSQYRRANLRVAIRQLERAELYVVALISLELDEDDVEGMVDELVERLRSLRAHLLGLKASA